MNAHGDDFMASLERVNRAILVRRNSVNDFFGDWQESDIDLLKRYQVLPAGEPPLGVIVDWLGL